MLLVKEIWDGYDLINPEGNGTSHLQPTAYFIEGWPPLQEAMDAFKAQVDMAGTWDLPERAKWGDQKVTVLWTIILAGG